MTTVAMNVCDLCLKGRGPLPLGGREVCRDPECFFHDEVRPSYDAMPSRLVPMVTAAEIEQARQLGEEMGPKVLELVREVQHAVAFLEDLELSDNPATQPESVQAAGFYGTLSGLKAVLAVMTQPPPPRPMDELVERLTVARLHELMEKER